MRIYILAVALIGAATIIDAQTVTCPTNAIQVTNGQFSIPRPQTDFQVSVYVYREVNDLGTIGNTLGQITNPNAIDHVITNVPDTVNTVNLLAFAPPNTQVTCTFTLTRSGGGNACSTNPCQNGGTCSVTGNTFQCSCLPNFSGPTCTTFNGGGGSCNPNPCQNNGVCSISNGQPQCACPTGFTGTQCESLVNPCNSSPCLNGGQCQIFGLRYQCNCPANFGGTRCQTATGGGTGSCSPNPCLNGGQCSSTGLTSFTCTCPNAYVGATCQTLRGSVTPCNPNPCLNNGQCSECPAGSAGCPNGYTCNCAGTNGRTGDQCQYSPAELCAPGSQGALACGQRTCLNRNVQGQPNYVCVCEDAFRMGFDCNVESDNRYIDFCYGQHCKRRVNNLGDDFNYFETIDFPSVYEDRWRGLYLLYLPGVTEICFEFDQQAFGIENDKDELYVGSGLQFQFADLQSENTPEGILFFENRQISNGRTPGPFCIPSDTVWMYFLTDKTIMMPGWRLYWTISDTVPPQATCPQDITRTVPLGAGGLSVTWTEPVAFDDSGVTPTLVSRSHSPGQFFASGRSITVTYTWRDGADNEGGCSFNVFIQEVDETPPNVVCPGDISVTTDCRTGGTTVTLQECTATDNSGTANLISQTHQSGQFFQEGRTEVTFTYQDPSGNRASGSYFVIVTEVDTTNPVCVPPNDITRTVNLGTAFTSVSWTEPVATDNCGQAQLVTRSHAPGDNFFIGTQRVSYTFRDAAGNTVVCGFDVTVDAIDRDPPVVTCPDDIRREIPLNVGSIGISFTPATATDNSGQASLFSSSHNPGQQFNVGSTTVTYTFEDPSGNRGSCSFTIVVVEVDRIPPQVTCPADVTERIQIGQGGTVIRFDEATATDNSGTAILVSRSHSPGQFYTTGVTEVTYEFQDPSGNTASCTFTITVFEVDDIPPIVTCPGDISVTTLCNTGGTTDVTLQPCTAVDNSGTATLFSSSHQSGQFFPIGRTEVTYTYEDQSNNRASGSYFVIVTEIDPTPPQCIPPPNDITRTISLGSGPTSVSWPEPRATDNCGATELVSRSHAPGDPFFTGTTTVTYTFRDAAGNLASCPFDVIITEVDREPPVVTCPDDISREIPLNVGSISISFTPATATDNSGQASLLSSSHNPGQQFNVGTTTVTYTFEDPSGNRASCSFTIVVVEVDRIPPRVDCPPDVTERIQLGQGGTVIQFAEATATDNSGTAILVSRSHSPGQFYTTGITEVTYEFRDQAGNTASCMFTITIFEFDDIPPTVTCPRDISVTTLCNTGGTTDVTLQPCTAVDNSRTATLISQTHQSGQFFPIGRTEVTYTYEDPSNNRASGSYTVTVTEIDPTPPECIPPPNDITRTISLGSSPTSVSWAEPRATDNCGIPELVSRSHNPGDRFFPGTTTVTYTFRDAAGNTAICDFDVTVTEVDDEDPVCDCGPEDDIIRMIPLNAGGANIVFEECRATDNSGIARLDDRTHSPGQRFPTGITRVQYTFSDPSGNSVTCGFSINIMEVDEEPPVCRQSNDVTQTVDLGQPGTLVTFTEPQATDNSGIANVVARTHTPGSFFTVGRTEVCYTFQDPSQNESPCCFNIIVVEVDNIPPNVRCPNDVSTTTACNTPGTTDVTWLEPTVTDNSGTSNLVSQTHRSGQTFFLVGPTTVTYVYTDPSGNRGECSFVVTVTEVDPTPPQCANVPQDIERTVSLGDGGATIRYTEPRANDDCGPATLQSRSNSPGDFFPTGSTRVTYIFADQAGNSVTCQFNVDVQEVDSIPPVCVCDEEAITRTIPINAGGASIVFPECQATDNSGSVSLTSRSHSPGQRFPTGVTRVEYVFSDPSLNTVTCLVTITVIEVDDEQPICRPTTDASAIISLNSFGTSVNFEEPQAFDNSGTVILRLSTHQPGAFFTVGDTRVTYTFADPSGNTADCSLTVTVIEVDDEDPVVTCPRDTSTTTACNTGGTIEVNFQPATATDNSGTATLLSQSHRPGQSFFTVGRTTVTYTFADPTGNRGNCEFVVTVVEIDPTPPQCTNTPQDITRDVALGSGGTTIQYAEPRATDDCGPVTLQSRTHGPGDFFNTGNTRVSYTFVDNSGNRVVCAFNIQINEVDRIPPVCDCGEDIFRQIPINLGGDNVVFPECTATDNSGSVSLVSRSHSPGQRFPTGVTVVEYEFSDPSQNRVTCDFRVTINEVDDVPPNCRPTTDASATIPLGTFGTSVNFEEPQAFDNSGTAILQSSTHQPGAFFTVGDTQVTYTFADPSGNTVECPLTVTVIEVDDTPPVVTCPRDVSTTTACNTGGTIDVNFPLATATDNSGTANLISQSHRPGQSFFPVGSTTVTFTFADPTGNRGNCEFDVTVIEIDPTPPQCTNTPQDITRQVPLGTGGTTIQFAEPRATDDCGPVTLQSRTHGPGDFFNTGPTRVSYTFVDNSGNRVVCAFNIQIDEVDRIPPVCDCGEDIFRQIEINLGGDNVVFPECTATDNSGSVSLVSRSHSPGQRFPTGVTTVEYVFSDPSQNRVTCDFTVTIIEVDIIPPTCRPTTDASAMIPLNSFGTSVNFEEPQAFDNSGTVTVQSSTHQPGAFFTVGDTQVIYTFADPSGNTEECLLTVTVIEVDDTPPVVTCPRDVSTTTACNTGGTIEVNFQPATATDNSGTANLISQSHRPGQSFFQVGGTTVSYTFADPTGNRASCEFEVTVVEIDPTPPQCTNTPQDITRQVPLGTGGTTIQFAEPRATDDCGPVTLQSRTHGPGDFFNTGPTRVSYTFVDNSGNRVVCAFSIQIDEVDRIPPVCDCGEDITRTIPINLGGDNVVFPECTATDNSGSVSLVSRSHSPGQRFPTGVTTVEYEFSDPSQNRVTCDFRVNIVEVDDEPPICRPTTDASEIIPLNSFGTSVNFEVPQAFDNSGTVTVQSSTHQPGAFFTVGDTQVTYTFADPSGNTVPCSLTVTVIEVDDTPPVVTCPRDTSTTTACNTGGTIEVNFQPATATDDSGTANLISQSHRPGQSFFTVGRTTVTYTFADPTGNRANCEFVVTVVEIDPTPPQCTNTPQDITREVPLGAGGTSIQFAEPRATDDCGTVTLQSRTHGPGDFFNTGNTRVSYTFVDNSENRVVCAFTIQINEVDRIPPVCDCGEDILRRISINLGGDNVVFPECTATDNSGSVSLVSRSHSPGQRFPTGVTTVEYEFSDPSQNRVTCDFRVTIVEVDDEPPICRPTTDASATISLNSFGTSVTFEEPQAFDNSGTVVLRSSTHQPGAFFTVGDTQVSYTFADPSGNTVECSLTVTVIEVDDTPPVVTCPRDVSTTTACNTGGTIEVNFQPATATDNSGTANLISQSHRPGQSFFQVGGTTVSYTFADPTGNRASCEFEVTVVEIDPIPPQCTNTPQDITRDVALGTGGTTIQYAEPRATDDCGPVTLQSRTHSPGDFFNTGPTRVSYTFVDNSGNRVVCAFNIQINEVDRIPPVCDCGEDIIRRIPLNLGGDNVVFPECTATDNSGSVSLVSRSHSPGQRFPTGNTVVEYEFSDPSQNRVTCDFTVTITEVDDEPPICRPTTDASATIPLNSFGTSVTFEEPQAFDNSGTVVLRSSTHQPGAFFTVGDTRVSYTFADPSGNTVECPLTVTVIEVDDTPPVVTCPRDVSTTTACNTGGTIEVNFQPATATDNSGTATLISQSHRPGQSFFQVGGTTVTYTFADPTGNRGNCEFEVTVVEIDPTPPQCTNTPQDITREVALGTGGTTIQFAEPRATDDCGPVTLQSRTHGPGDFFNTGPTRVSYTFVDNSGNRVVCAFSIQINEVDRIPPVCDCGEDITRTIPINLGGDNVVFPECTATDNSGSVSLVSRSHSPGQRFPTGVTTVEYEFSDPSQNRVTCNFRVTIIEVDEIPPRCLPTSDTSVDIPLGTFGTSVNFQEPEATDNSGTATQRSTTHRPGAFFTVGDTQVTYTFVDPSGNTADCTLTVTVVEVDDVPPNPICPDDITRSIDINVGGTTVTFDDATATDNSGTAIQVSQTHTSGQFFSVGVTEITYTFRDPSFNTDSCSFTVTVVEFDDEPPTIVFCPQDIFRTISINSGGIVITWPEPVAFDNSQQVTLQSVSHLSGDFFEPGEVEVVYIFADPVNNTDTCIFTITVEEVDTDPPVPQCPDDQEVSIPLASPPGSGRTTVTWITPTATDNSGTYSIDSNTHTSGDLFTTGSTRVSYVFVDPSNNRATCSWTITVVEVDSTPPVCTCGQDVTQTTPLGSGGRNVVFQECTATDNSGVVTRTSRSHAPGAFFTSGRTDVNYVFEDPSGNTVACSLTVTVNEIDEVPPQVIGCPADIQDTVDLGQSGKTVTWPEPTSRDNSGTSTMTSRSHRPNSFFLIGVTEVTYEFSDPSGNTATCSFTITIIEIDNEPPVVICPAPVQLTILSGMGGASIEWDEATATDNSGTANLVSRSQTPGSFFQVGQQTVTYTFEDPSGNRGTCSFTVTITAENPCLPQPCLNGGTCVIESTTTYTCLCTECFSGDICQDGADACTNHGCSNGAICQAFPNSCTEYECQCTDCFSGRFCTERADPCENHQCQNGAQCATDPNDCTAYTCICPSCFSGQFCQIAFDACSNNQCINGGRCVQITNGGCTEYTCACSGCFSGPFCQDMRDPCAGNPCLNGAICSPLQDNCYAYQCQCNGCFTGYNCEVAVPNPCNENPCLNNGVCNIIPGECFAYSCRCQQGFTGINCGQIITENVNPCTSFPCQNGGSCLTMDATYYICVCPTDFLGINCQTRRTTQINFDACPVNNDPCREGDCYNSFHSNSAPNNIFQRQYTCVCNRGFTGTNCAISTIAQPRLDICNLSGQRMCLNGGTCFNDYHSYDQDVDYFCQCPIGFIGHNCETVFVDPCRSSPCLNAGQCQSFNTFFTCQCQSGYAGTLCQINTNIDSQPPIIQGCPPSQYFFTNSGRAQATWTPPTATDNVDARPRLDRQSHQPNQFFSVGTTAVTYVFVDSSNNAASCTFFITVYSQTADITPPVVSGCPPGVSVSIGVGETGGIGRWSEPTATDNSGASPSRVRTHTPGSIFPRGTTRVMYTFSDGSNNVATCSFNVVVSEGEDNERPDITGCPTSTVLVQVPPTAVSGIGRWNPIQATDNSGINPSLDQTHRSGDSFPLGATQVTYTFTDGSGNIAVCRFTVNVVRTSGPIDQIPPVIRNCPTGVQIQVSNTANSGTASWTVPTATDDSGLTPNRVSTHDPGDTFNIGITTVTYTFTDGTGNAALCFFDVTVTRIGGGGGAMLTFCPNDIIAPASQGSSFQQISWQLPTATGATLESATPFGPTVTSSFFGVGQNAIRDLLYTFVDTAGNELTCGFRVGAIVNPPNPCFASPCQNGGQCNQITNSYECSCPAGFGGNKCQTPISPTNACSSSPCLNGGNCQTFNNGYFCACVNGFSGTRCQLPPTTNPCASSPCLNNGQCSQQGNGYICACFNGYQGTRCQIPPTNACASSPCLNNGQCSPQGNGFFCSCANGYSGTRCQTPPPTDGCSSSPCLNGATCFPFGTNGNYFCSCPAGFTGSRCENGADAEACDSSPCMNGATCFSFDSNGISNFFCSCPSGFEGNRCETPTGNACASGPCLNNGQCSQLTNGYFCSCVDGYSGTRCQTPPAAAEACDSSPCMNGATCFSFDSNGISNFFCNCPTGFTGTRCETSSPSTLCTPNPCQNGGQCTVRGNSFSCNCPAGFGGITCQNDNAAPTVTNCPQSITETTTATATSATVIFFMPTATDNSGGDVFLAYTTNQGDSISVSEIEPDQQGRARLQATFDVGETTVTVIASDISGNTNNQCQFTVTVERPSTACNSSPCLNGGTCTTTANGYSCSCVSGFSGTRCQTGGGGDNPCASNPCPDGLLCYYTPRQYICTPVDGRKRRDVDGVTSNWPCVNGGVVEHGDHGSRCNCQPGFTGVLCADNPCQSNPCPSQTDCFYTETQYICIRNPCSPNPCPAGQSCFYTTDMFICQTIPAGRKRRDVEDVQSQYPCQNGATIKRGEYGNQCICQPGFTGVLCEVQIELEDINQTMPVHPNHDLQPPITRGNFLTNGVVFVAMGVLMIVIVVLALVVCRLSPRSRNSILLGKTQRSDEVAIVQ